MTLRHKLLALISTFCIVLAVFASVVYLSTSETVEDSDYHDVIAMKDLVADILPPPEYIVESYLVSLRLATERDPAVQDRLVARLGVLRQEFQDRYAFWTRELEAADLRQTLAKAQEPAMRFYEAAAGQLVPAVKAGDPAKALAVVQGTLAPLYEEHRAAIDSLVSQVTVHSKRSVDAAATAIRARKRNLVGFAFIAGLAAAAVGWLIARGISRRTSILVSALQRVAERDFTGTITVDSRDELGQMATAANDVVVSVRRVLLDVRNVSDGVASAARELAAASEEISSGAQQQASSLEETAASLEEITATIKQNADNARQANQIARGSREAAERGGAVVGDTVRAMKDINQASSQIAEIITTIDEIAFQTNLLALNAAVEAARAGEQGRGFAVVAVEVRNLAQRSAVAAKEIKALIIDSMRKVENGSALVGQSGTTLDGIITSVKRVTDIVGEMSAAAREQSSGVDQVNTAVVQMDQVTQSSAARTEELSATAQSLTGQADRLRGLIAGFRLGDDAPAAAVVSVRVPAPSYPVRRAPVSRRPALGAARPAGTAADGDHEAMDDFMRTAGGDDHPFDEA